MLKCKDIPVEAEKLLADELSFSERVSVRMHLFICHNCRRYVRQLKILLRSLNQFHNAPNKQTVDEEQINAIIQRTAERSDQPPL